MVAGVVLAVKGFARGNRSGLGENRFVGVLVLALAGFTFSWLVVLAIIGNAMHVASPAFGLAVIWSPALGVFSAGSLAFLGMGPFRYRISAVARVRQIMDGNRSAWTGTGASAIQVAEAERALELRSA